MADNELVRVIRDDEARVNVTWPVEYCPPVA